MAARAMLAGHYDYMTNIAETLGGSAHGFAGTGAAGAVFKSITKRVRIVAGAALGGTVLAAALTVATMGAEAAPEMTPRDQDFQPIKIVPTALVQVPDSMVGVEPTIVEEEPVAPAPIETDLGQGEASYYGAAFAGRRTANGERFDPAQLTAAHRTLPMGSMVRVTNVRTGKSVVVRINDRGPFHGNRVIDLSKAAASEIGLIQAGRGQVQLALLD